MYQPLFFGSYLPDSKLGRERLTVSPQNLRLEVRFSGVSIFLVIWRVFAVV